MNKKDFLAMLGKELNGKSIEQKLKILNSINTKINKWIKEYSEKITKNYTFCPKCQKYYLTTKFREITLREVREGVCVYRDSWDGSCDEYADIIYKVTYSVCPHCNYKSEIHKDYIKEKRRYGRDGKEIS